MTQNCFPVEGCLNTVPRTFYVKFQKGKSPTYMTIQIYFWRVKLFQHPHTEAKVINFRQYYKVYCHFCLPKCTKLLKMLCLLMLYLWRKRTALIINFYLKSFTTRSIALDYIIRYAWLKPPMLANTHKKFPSIIHINDHFFFVKSKIKKFIKFTHFVSFNRTPQLCKALIHKCNRHYSSTTQLKEKKVFLRHAYWLIYVSVH